MARHVFPELLHRGKHTDAAAVLVAVTAGGKREGVGEAFAKLLKSLRQSARDEDAVKRLIDALGDEDLDRLDRDAVVALLAVAGKKAASGLRELYAKTQDQTVRGSAFDAMMGIGLPALEAFLAELANSEEEWPVVHHILGALGDQTDPALAKPIERFLAHENDHVRHVALTRVFELLGAESEELLIRALDDPGAVTRHAAVAYLGQLQSRNPNVLDFYVAALGVEVPKDESGQSEEVLVEVCRSLAGLGEATLGHGIGLEDFLLDALTHSRSPNCAGTRSGKRTHPFADERDGSGGTVVVARAQPLQCVRLSFSCKTRGSCPSCGARHMAETAAHMVDNVFPHVPVRQFVLSVPKRLRPFLHYRPKTATAVLHILLRALQATLREACPTAPATASLGVVSFLHRFGSSLNPHFHYHLCVVDGLFDATEMDQHPETRSSDLRFHEATDLSPQLLERLQHTVRKRVLRHVRRQGLLEPHEAEDMLTWDHGGGFSLDATVRIEATDRAGLERLIRYCARPPFALTSSVDDPTKCSTSCRCPIPPAARRSASRPWSFWTALPLSFPRPEFIATATTGSSHPMPP